MRDRSRTYDTGEVYPRISYIYKQLTNLTPYIFKVPKLRTILSLFFCSFLLFTVFVETGCPLWTRQTTCRGHVTQVRKERKNSL